MAKAYNSPQSNPLNKTHVSLMTVVDIVIIVVISLSALFSVLRGFVKEAISLASWVVAIWLAVTFAPRLAELLPPSIESEAVRQAIGFGVIFVLTLMVGAIVNKLTSQVVKKNGTFDSRSSFWHRLWYCAWRFNYCVFLSLSVE